MTHETADKDLLIKIDQEELRELQEMSKDDRRTDDAMVEFFEDFIANSEFDWIRAEETGDLTDAPLLGIRDSEGKVVERWGFMNYQIQSVLQVLHDNCMAVFQGAS